MSSPDKKQIMSRTEFGLPQNERAENANEFEKVFDQGAVKQLQRVEQAREAGFPEGPQRTLEVRAGMMEVAEATEMAEREGRVIEVGSSQSEWNAALERRRNKERQTAV